MIPAFSCYILSSYRVNPLLQYTLHPASNMSEGGTQVITESPNYKYERVRLETFQSWPANAKVEAWKMARAGLLYTGQGEEVRCLWCGVVLADWQFGDQVMARHRA